MKWLLDRIGRLFAAYSQKPASGYEPITPADPHQTNLVPTSEPQRSSERIGWNFDAKRKEFGVEDELKDIPGVTTRMLAAFGKHGIKSIEILPIVRPMILMAGEIQRRKTIKHKGIPIVSRSLARIARQ